MPPLSSEHFPRLEQTVRGKWAPIFLSPLIGSPERLVIGVLAANDSGFHIERANALFRFECLYDGAAETAIFAAEVALDDLEADCAERGMEALTDPRPTFSGVSVGGIHEGEAPSLEDIARTWMASLSSLYNGGDAHSLGTQFDLAPMAYGELVSVGDGQSGERLPSLVFDYIIGKRPGFEKFFNADIRGSRQRRSRRDVPNVIIDFSGSRLVANFGTLKPKSRAASVDRIKRRMFDLIVMRDRDRNGAFERAHEMIVQRPSEDDPQISERQIIGVKETIGALAVQARVEDIALHSMTNVFEIGEYVLRTEATGSLAYSN